MQSDENPTAPSMYASIQNAKSSGVLLGDGHCITAASCVFDSIVIGTDNGDVVVLDPSGSLIFAHRQLHRGYVSSVHAIHGDGLDTATGVNEQWLIISAGGIDGRIVATSWFRGADLYTDLGVAHTRGIADLLLSTSFKVSGGELLFVTHEGNLVRRYRRRGKFRDKELVHVRDEAIVGDAGHAATRWRLHRINGDACATEHADAENVLLVGVKAAFVVRNGAVVAHFVAPAPITSAQCSRAHIVLCTAAHVYVCIVPRTAAPNPVMAPTADTLGVVRIVPAADNAAVPHDGALLVGAFTDSGPFLSVLCKNVSIHDNIEDNNENVSLDEFGVSATIRAHQIPSLDIIDTQKIRAYGQESASVHSVVRVFEVRRVRSEATQRREQRALEQIGMATLPIDAHCRAEWRSLLHSMYSSDGKWTRTRKAAAKAAAVQRRHAYRRVKIRPSRIYSRDAQNPLGGGVLIVFDTCLLFVRPVPRADAIAWQTTSGAIPFSLSTSSTSTSTVLEEDDADEATRRQVASTTLLSAARQCAQQGWTDEEREIHNIHACRLWRERRYVEAVRVWAERVLPTATPVFWQHLLSRLHTANRLHLIEKYLPFNSKYLVPPRLYTHVLLAYLRRKHYRSLLARVCHWPTVYEWERLVDALCLCITQEVRGGDVSAVSDEWARYGFDSLAEVADSDTDDTLLEEERIQEAGEAVWWDDRYTSVSAQSESQWYWLLIALVKLYEFGSMHWEALVVRCFLPSLVDTDDDLAHPFDDALSYMLNHNLWRYMSFKASLEHEMARKVRFPFVSGVEEHNDSVVCEAQLVALYLVRVHGADSALEAMASRHAYVNPVEIRRFLSDDATLLKRFDTKLSEVKAREMLK